MNQSWHTCLRSLASDIHCCIGRRVMSHVTYKRVMSRINESCHICMSQVTNEYVMAHVHAQPGSDIYYSIWRVMSHVTYKRVMSHTNESCHICMSHVTNEYIMAHVHAQSGIWHTLLHQKRVIAWHPTYAAAFAFEELLVISHINESCHICMSRVTYKRVMAHVHAQPGIRHTLQHQLTSHKSCHVYTSHGTYAMLHRESRILRHHLKSQESYYKQRIM